MLLESTGAPNGTGSSLQYIDAKTGKIQTRIDIPGVFAEGIAVAGSCLVQLTWQDHFAFVRNSSNGTEIGRFIYKGEGWGLASDGKRYFMSNGSDSISIRSIATFSPLRSFAVRKNGIAVRNLNELELDQHGTLWANVWYQSEILGIDTATGTVKFVLNCQSLVDQCTNLHGGDVLNGIAFDSSDGTFWITGKNWPTIFRIRMIRAGGKV